MNISSNSLQLCNSTKYEKNETICNFLLKTLSMCGILTCVKNPVKHRKRDSQPEVKGTLENLKKLSAEGARRSKPPNLSGKRIEF